MTDAIGRIRDEFSPIGRIGDAFRVGRATSWLIALAVVCGVTVVAAVATRLGVLPIALALVLGAIATVASFRWPLLTLALFAMFIPIEEVLVVEGVGTVSRAAAILFAVSYGVPRLSHLTLGAMPRAGWLYVVWAMLSLGWSISPNAAVGELPTLLQLFIVAVLIADFVVRRPEIVRPILWVYSLSAAASAVVGVAAYLAQGGAASRTAALSTDAAQFAAVLLPALAFALFELLSGRHRLLAAPIALATSMGIIVSGTRGAWVAVVVVVGLFILPRLPGRQRAVALVAVAALVVAAFQLPGISDLVAARTGNALSTGGAGRADIWTVGAQIYLSAPVVGVGYANFPVAYTPQAVAAANISSAYRAESGDAPHNVVIGTLVELGPLGLLLLMLFLGPLVLRRGWGSDAPAVQASLAGLMVAALFLDILANRKQVWLIIGIAAGLSYLAATRGERSPIRLPVELAWGRRRTPAPAIPPDGDGADQRRASATTSPARSRIDT